MHSPNNGILELFSTVSKISHVCTAKAPRYELLTSDKMQYQTLFLYQLNVLCHVCMKCRWCIYLRHKSSGAYDLLRESGVVSLPSQRTLRDYTHYIPPTVGFSFEIDQQLIAAAQVEKLEDWQQYVIMILDEMHIKQHLVYEKHSGEFIGFADLGSVNQALLSFEQSLEQSTESESLAKTMCVYQVAIPLCSVSLCNSYWRSDV